MPTNETESLKIARQIDLICDAYETQWQTGGAPKIEDYLVGLVPSVRSLLVLELCALDIEYRQTRGQSVSVHEYLVRFPELSLNQLQEIVDRTAQLPRFQETQHAGVFRQVHQPLNRIPYFGDYELLEVWARGGMGTVYRARQVSLNRIVAVKMINSGLLASEDGVARFYKEASAAASLQHPHIVPVFEVGQHEGVHFYSMAFVDGESLGARLANGPMDLIEAAELVVRVCLAIQHAHDQGIIHRDIKPSNILIDKQGHAWVGDFGLAKRTSDNSLLTSSGDILGTPSYMPPEQASGAVNSVVGQSDVYSLGAVLYTCLCGRPPFQAATKLQTLQQVVQDEPVQARQLNSVIPRDLETIVHKCLDKSIAKRYASPRALQEDLERFLENKPILARPIHPIERAWRWCRRNPARALNLAGAAAVVVGVLVTWQLVSLYEAYRQREGEADSFCDRIKICSPQELPRMIDEFHQGVTRLPMLESKVKQLHRESSDGTQVHYRTSLALLGTDASMVSFVCDGLLHAGWDEFNWGMSQVDVYPQLVARWLGNIWRTRADRLGSEEYARLVAIAHAESIQPYIQSELGDVSFDNRRVIEAVLEELVRDPSMIDAASKALQQTWRDSQRWLVEYFDYRTKLLRVDAATSARLAIKLLPPTQWLDIGSSSHHLVLSSLFEREPLTAVVVEQLRSVVKEDSRHGGTWDDYYLHQRRKAIAGSLLFLAGEDVSDLLNYSLNPTVRSLMIDWIPRIKPEPTRVLEQIQVLIASRSGHVERVLAENAASGGTPINPWLSDPPSSQLRGLLLMLGNYSTERLKEPSGLAVLNAVEGLYRKDPDPGIHGISEWLLRRHSKSLPTVDSSQAPTHADWQAGPNGHTMIRIKGPVDFNAGTVDNDPYRDAGIEVDKVAGTITEWSDDHPHRKLINRSFMIDMNETSYGQMQSFNSDFHQKQNKSLAPDLDQAACRISWHMAAEYCNWMSKVAGIPEDEHCFVRTSANEWKLADKYLSKRGYRLPSHAEWELACRALSTTRYYFGDSEELLDQYAWHNKNSLELSLAKPFALKPNDLGLFNTLGNVYEWTMDRFDGKQSEFLMRSDDVEFDRSDWPYMVLRGGSIFTLPRDVRGVECAAQMPSYFEGNTGFRVARTVD